MRLAQLATPSIKLFITAALAITPLAARAQYSQGPQPYNSGDPQNYGSPAAQSYGQQPSYQQQPSYPQQGGYGQQNQQVYSGAPDGAYDPNANGQGDPQYSGQQQIYQAPPPLPSYDQPVAPGDGYIWTPGYWAFGRGGYFWVPGQWVLPPYEDALWTPGYWGYGYGGGYFWNAGYWGPFVGFYGGINYGFGYFGTGFYGGYWRDHRFFYNREYVHVGFNNHFVYSQRFNGISNIRPGGASFTTHVALGNQFRGGSYPGQGGQFRGVQPGGNGYAGSQRGGSPQTVTGRAGYSYAGPSNGFNGGNRGLLRAPAVQPGAGNLRTYFGAAKLPPIRSRAAALLGSQRRLPWRRRWRFIPLGRRTAVAATSMTDRGLGSRRALFCVKPSSYTS